MRMLRTNKRARVTFLLVGVLILGVGFASAVMAQTTSENIKLEGVPGSFAEGASGQTQMYIWHHDGGILFDTQIHGLRPVRGQIQAGGGFYSIYAITESHGRQRLYSFNASAGDQVNFVGAVFEGDSDEIREIYRTEDVRVEVWVEADDGVETPDFNPPGALVLVGTLDH